MEKEKEWNAIEFSLHAILSGVLMNGWIQGKDDKKIDTTVIDIAIKEIEQIIKQKQ